MKLTENNTIRHIAAVILAIAIVLTGISFSNTTTAYAASEYAGMENIEDLQNTTITMKIGDTKSIYAGNEYAPGYVISNTDSFDWSTSDETVVSMKKVYYSYDPIVEPSLRYLTLTAEKTGTAVITAAHETTGETMSFTIVVKQKMTSKQKKCSHKFKTTKKATCLRSGMKTCTKCKLQRTIAKKEHKFETNYEEKKTIRKYVVYYCPFCGGTFDPYDYGCTGPGGDLEKNKAAEKAAEDAYFSHLGKCESEHPDSKFSSEGNQTIMEGGGTGLIDTGHWWFIEASDYAHATTEIVRVTRCVYCENTKEDIEKYY